MLVKLAPELLGVVAVPLQGFFILFDLLVKQLKLSYFIDPFSRQNRLQFLNL